MKLIKWWNRYWFESGSALNLALFRILIFIGATAFVAHNSVLSQLQEVYPNWDPISFFQLLNGPLSITVRSGLFFIWTVSSLLAGLGLFFRWSAITSFVSAVLLLGHAYNFGFVYHSNHLYVMTLGFLAFSRAGDALALRRQPRPQAEIWHYSWPISLTKAYIVWIFFICGVEKLYFGGGVQWAFSDSLALRLLSTPKQGPWTLLFLEKPSWVLQVMAAWGLFVAELMAPLALWNRHLGILYTLIWTSLHLGTTMVFTGHEGFFVHIIIYLAFWPLDAIYLLMDSSGRGTDN